ncbi:hypothetical protein WICPIJ_005551 [Wickerhamomyces pijperi]|uniref:Secreted protein n=1 Tax=Wickerhamomyces pijperi TaxID=599730 RepID=A0A9P8Q3T2_WICPI|nr:hypothetical protein WICPIJ_005551 [Wickerhamomyces pijperi]
MLIILPFLVLSCRNPVLASAVRIVVDSNKSASSVNVSGLGPWSSSRLSHIVSGEPMSNVNSLDGDSLGLFVVVAVVVVCCWDSSAMVCVGVRGKIGNG